MKSFALALAVCMALSANLALAQPDAGAKARGEFHFYGRAGGRAMHGARESVNAFREYMRSAQPEPPPVVREAPPSVVVSPRIAQVAVDEIGDYIFKTERHLAWMRTQAEASGDKETLASLDSIDRNLAVGKTNHAALCRSCAADTIDPAAAMACCQTIDASLAKAISEHDALMKRLGETRPVAK